MKYHAIFPAESGQVAGRHSFRTARELSAFLARMKQRGIEDRPIIVRPAPGKKGKK